MNHELSGLAAADRRAGRAADAIALHERVLEVRLRQNGPDHQLNLLTKSELAASYEAAGRTAEALVLLEQIRAVRGQGSAPTRRHGTGVPAPGRRLRKAGPVRPPGIPAPRAPSAPCAKGRSQVAGRGDEWGGNLAAACCARKSTLTLSSCSGKVWRSRRPRSRTPGRRSGRGLCSAPVCGASISTLKRNSCFWQRTGT